MKKMLQRILHIVIRRNRRGIRTTQALQSNENRLHVLFHKIAKRIVDSLSDLADQVETKAGLNQFRERPKELIKQRIATLESANKRLTTEINQLKQIEKELRKSEERYRNFLNNLGDTAYEIDNKGNITYANKTAEDLTGIPVRDMINKPFLPLVSEKSQKDALDVYRRTLQGESPEYEIMFKCGRIGLLKNEPLRDNEGNIIGVFGIAKDITERKHLEEMKSRFFTNISHEFRTPLTLILGPIKDLLSKCDDEQSKQQLTMIQRHSNHLLQLVNQLLDLARLDSVKPHLQKSPGNIVQSIEDVIKYFASFAEHKQVQLKFNVQHSQNFLPNIYFDRDMIEKVFYNLLSNALKFTPKGGVVSVDVNFIQMNNQGQKRCVEIKVTDTGIGIPVDQIPKIFDRFYQVENPDNNKQEGTGIGLALAKEFIELHDGYIYVESEQGLGTAFWIYLPISEVEIVFDRIDDHQLSLEKKSPKLATDLEPAEDLNCDDTIILVIEDHPDVSDYIQRFLERCYKVIKAVDGQDGIKKAIEFIPDLIISDIMMPKKDGYQVCQCLKTNEKTSHIPIILLTAKAAADDKITGYKIGADDYIIKPFDLNELKVRVENLINSRRQLRQRFATSVIIKPGDIDASSMDKSFLKKVMSIIEQNMADENFNVTMLSDKMGMSQSQIYRKLRALTNQSTVQFIQSVRLQHAARLLRQDSATIAEIAYQCGFKSPAYFTKCFHEKFGSTPHEYIKNRLKIRDDSQTWGSIEAR